MKLASRSFPLPLPLPSVADRDGKAIVRRLVPRPRWGGEGEGARQVRARGAIEHADSAGANLPDLITRRDGTETPEQTGSETPFPDTALTAATTGMYHHRARAYLHGP